jgi:biopolymer transport protein ExbD
MARRNNLASSNVLNPNLTALLDVVLQLITFFMMLVHFGTRLEGATKAVRLPLAPAALPGTELTFDRLAVAMNAQGQLLVKGKSLDEEAANAFWADEARARRAGIETLGEGATALENLPTVVILRADRSA